MDQTNRTWGYRPTGEAKIFDLALGAPLPEGWEASPACITDPALATAEALTAAAEGRPYAAPLEAAPIATSHPLAELEASVAEIERLKAIIAAGTEENARLVAEIEQAEADLDLTAKDIIALRASLEQAQRDGGFAAEERDAAKADLDALGQELARVRADLDTATAPKPAAKAGK
ncbi:hypothetical protein [Methylobacterium aquaticum]|uniref:Chromosome segregation ATPases n=1 Tax=Methylobacterium aquaticum TaxID=270351 RepID=A0A0C6FAX9_9HYPH|nr:hypothetical protein [Methylobacterium aquaticum]BAQ43972.1 chromosome segregation ATPases [Methylobacterium aquaticum]